MKIKLYSLFIIVIVLTIMPISSVMAAPSHQEPTPPPDEVQPITGTITAIEIQGDPAAATASVLLTLQGEDGTVQTVTLTLEVALSLGLVTTLPDGSYTVNESMIGTAITIDPSQVIVEVEGKVPNAIAEFFASLFSTDASTIMAYHENGMGYGVIVQAGFMAYAMGGDGSTMDAILLAKQSGDFSTILLPDGSFAKNWGDLRKAVLTNGKSLTNLGAIMSGHATENVDKDHGQSDKDNPAGKEKPNKNK
jgi:hypothetical protein